MPSVRKALIFSLAANATPEAEASRRLYLEKMESPLRRGGALALHNFATKRPSLAAAMLGLRYDPHPPELQFIGNGSESSVFKVNEEEVIKFSWVSLLARPGRLAEYIQKRRLEHSALRQHLGEFVIPQTTSVGPHPYFAERDGMQHRQPFVAFHDPQLFTEGTAEGMAERIIGLGDMVDDPEAQLREVIERSRSLYTSPIRALPDYNGGANFVIESGNFRIVDGQPITADQAPNQLAILTKLATLEEALNLT